MQTRQREVALAPRRNGSVNGLSPTRGNANDALARRKESPALTQLPGYSAELVFMDTANVRKLRSRRSCVKKTDLIYLKRKLDPKITVMRNLLGVFTLG